MFKIFSSMMLVLAFGLLASAQLGPQNPADQIRKMSAHINDGLQQNADLLSPQDQQAVMDLLREIRDRLQNVSPGQGLVASQTMGPISRKTGGEWVTMTLPQPALLGQINLRGIGNSKVRIYRVNLVNTAGENIAIKINNVDLQGNTNISQPLNFPTPIRYIQVLSESFGDNMYIGIDAFAAGQVGNPPPPPPVVVQPPPFQPPVASMDLSCVARDGDGLAPFIVISRNPIDFSIVKFPDVKFRSMQECQTEIQSTISIVGNSYMCASRDGDSLPPVNAYAVGSSTISKLGSLVFKTLADCHTAFSHSKVSPIAIGLCSSRDGDNLAPWLLYTINHSTLQVQPHNEQTFQSQSSCQAGLL